MPLYKITFIHTSNAISFLKFEKTRKFLKLIIRHIFIISSLAKSTSLKHLWNILIQNLCKSMQISKSIHSNLKNYNYNSPLSLFLFHPTIKFPSSKLWKIHFQNFRSIAIINSLPPPIPSSPSRPSSVSRTPRNA